MPSRWRGKFTAISRRCKNGVTNSEYYLVPLLHLPCSKIFEPYGLNLDLLRYRSSSSCFTNRQIFWPAHPAFSCLVFLFCKGGILIHSGSHVPPLQQRAILLFRFPFHVEHNWHYTTIFHRHICIFIYTSSRQNSQCHWFKPYISCWMTSMEERIESKSSGLKYQTRKPQNEHKDVQFVEVT